jgi:hypothetical protein
MNQGFTEIDSTNISDEHGDRKYLNPHFPVRYLADVPKAAKIDYSWCRGSPCRRPQTSYLSEGKSDG